MGICLHAAVRFRANPTVSVPAPVDAKTPDVDWWYDHLAKQCAYWASIGVTSILLPPICKTNAGAYPGADGYGCYDDYDIGSKNQYFSRETRFGNREQLMRLVAVAAANGIDVYIDFVPHQRSGGSYGTYKYLGADGKTFNGRFAKTKKMFRGNPKDGYSAQDPVAAPADDWAFGDELCPVNCPEAGQGLIEAGIWTVKSLGLKGGRIDDTKGQVPWFVKKWAQSVRAACGDLYFFQEYADGNPDTLNWVVENSGMDGTVAAADFSIHYILQAMCNNTSKWDMRQLDHAGFIGRNPTQAFSFIESPDTDTNGFAGIIWNKAAAYFYILTSEGYPCVYYRDWSSDKNCYGLAKHINNYMWINNFLARGNTVCRHKDYQTIVYERMGAPGLLCGMNNDWGNTYSYWVQTNFGPNVQLHDYTGHAGDIWTNQDGWVYITIPPNSNGLGTVAYSRAGHDKAITPGHRSVTQSIFGAADLDVKPATDDAVIVPPIFCEKNTKVKATLHLQKQAYPKGAQLSLSFYGPDKNVIETIDLDPNKAHTHTFTTKVSGYHDFSLELRASNGMVANYELQLTYTAPKSI